MKDFKFLDSLFVPEKKILQKRESIAEESTKQRTFKIETAHWDDFVLLVRALGNDMTQAKLINILIARAVEEYRETIEKYREITK